MTLKAIFKWKNPDSTIDMNQRLQTLVPRGIFDGGDVSPGGGLTVNVTPFSAIGYDGMLVTDDATQTLSVQNGQVNYVVVRAKYATGTTPTVQWEVMTQASYNGDPDRNYLIVFAVIDMSTSPAAVTNTHISMLDRDAVDPMQRHTLRGVAATPAALPTHPPEQNREGDLYFVSSMQTIYYWDSTGSTWSILGSGAYNVETTSMADVVLQGERNRIEQGSGVLGGVRPSDAFGADPDITIIETPSVVNQIGFDTFSAIVNGHYVQPHARYVTMPTKPGTGTRYDLVFLEVWRESITTPESYTFESSPDGATTYSITQISDRTEQIIWQAGPAVGNNFDVNELQVDDHAYVVTKYRLSTVEDTGGGATPDTQALYDNKATAPLAQNIDSNFFVADPGSGADPNCWMAASTTASDGFSWAIPLFVVKRTSAEDWTSPVGAIQEFRSHVRFVFPVYRSADQNEARRAIETEQRTEPSAWPLTAPPYEKASGFLDSLDFQIPTGAPHNAINFYASAARIRVRGLEDHLDFSGGPDVDLSAPPSTGYERSLVYIKMSLTLYADATTRDNTMISARHRPYFPSYSTVPGSLSGQGYRRGYCTFEVVHENLGAAATELDEHDAMTAAGWTKGDLSLSSTSKEYEDGGVWSKAVVLAADDRIHPWLYEWAIPVCLVHRRNSAAWHYATNPNGTGATRPDDRTNAAVISADDLVDLRRMVDVDPARLKDILEQDLDRIQKGQLRTRMAEKWAGSGAGSGTAGSRLLQSDFASTSSATGFVLPDNDSKRKIWSDAREFVPVAESFDMNPALGVYSGDYVTCNRATGAITITAPTGAHLCRHLPALYYTSGDSTKPNFLQYEADPLFVTREDFDTNTVFRPTPVEAKVIKGATDIEEALQYTNIGWTFNTTTQVDALGHATDMDNTIDYTAPYIAGDTCVVSFWVHYDRSYASSSGYNVNWGLAEIPDEVHKVERGTLGGSPEDVNVGTLYATVRKNPGGASMSITSAEVAAASGVPGTHTIVGVDWTGIRYASDPVAVALSTIDLNAAQTQIDITWSGALAMDVEVVVFFYTTDVDKWVEIGKGGKSVRGYFSWEDTKTHDWGGAPGSTLAFDTSTSVWQDAEVADRFVAMPQIWTSTTGPSGPWTLWMGPLSTKFRVGYQYSNMISISDPSGATPAMTDQYFKFVYPKWDAPSIAITDDLMVHYTYTPYQGLSSTGGAAATPATAVAQLKQMIHGTVEENSDFYVSQSGACSVFGGVDGWTGWPTRRPDSTLNFDNGRFLSYNQTQLVKSTKAAGTVDLGSGADPESLAPAAILRLPFPNDNTMHDGSNLYHIGTTDFDIDPGREGVNAGYFSYAPGYPSLLTAYASGTAIGILYDQFVNGISRLAVPGETQQQVYSHLLAASQYQGTATNAAVYNANTSGLQVTAGAVLQASYALNLLEGHILARSLTALDGVDFSGTPDDLDGTGLKILHPYADFTGGVAPTANYDDQVAATADYLFTGNATGPAANAMQTLPGGLETSATTAPIFMGTAAGTLFGYYMLSHRLVTPALWLNWTAGNAVYSRHVFNTVATVEGDRSLHTGVNNLLPIEAPTGVVPIGTARDYGSSTDLIRLPLGSCSYYPGSYGTNQRGRSDETAGSSLRGREVGYPSSWGATTVTAAEGYMRRSELFHPAAYGRGLFLGVVLPNYTTMARFNMPVLVPGSGTAMSRLILADSFFEETAQPPPQFPASPTTAPFATTNRVWDLYDHGGPIAYSFYGMMINPSSDDYKGQAVMQITGGPTMGYGGSTTSTTTPTITDGTALDAFWPSGRPIIRNS